MKDFIKELIQKSIENLISENEIANDSFKIILERPAEMSNGDYATNIAMLLAPKLKEKKAPLSLAIEIVEKIKENLKDFSATDTDGASIEKVEVAGPGFINFHIAEGFYAKNVEKIIDGADSYGSNEIESGKKIVFEYTDPNPFKVFHIGHLMSNTIGESLVRLAENAGAEVKRYCYQGDKGRHVALTIWGLRLMDELIPNDNAPLKDKVAYFGKAYSLGATRFKKLEDENTENQKENGASGDDESAEKTTEFKKMEEEVREINRKIYDRSDEEVNAIYDKGREWSLQHFEEIYETLGTKFDRYFFESQTADIGKEIVLANTAPDGLAIFEKSQGATIFPGEKYGLHTRVFLTKDGTPLYEAKEIGLAREKYEAYPYDLGITVTANEQDDYFKVLLKATELLFPEIGKKAKHISHGMLRLTSGKMSSRTGDVITGESLLNDMLEQALEKMADREMSEEDKKEVAKMIAVAGIKYTVLRQAAGKNIIFDPSKSLSLEGDSGPYLQYSYVRACSLLAKAEKEGIEANANMGADKSIDGTSTSVSDDKLNPETRLVKLLERFAEVSERAWIDLAPHHVANYLMELAGTFNSFYASAPIVDKNSAESPWRVALVKSFSIVMKNGLHLLGIKTPAKM